MNPDPRSQPPQDHEDNFRPHTYDGIREYDKRLPNWWLYTLYASIAFAIVYWFVYRTARIMPTDGSQVDHEMAQIAAAKLASSIDVTDDGKFWEMSASPAFVESGKQTYAANCAACHLPSLRGKGENPGAVGPDLTDTAWIHGGTPKEVYATVAKGVAAKGMPPWEPVLGQKKTAEVVAFLLSHHQQGEPVTVEGAK